MDGLPVWNDKGNYVEVGDLEMYYQIHGPNRGETEPLILLHGGMTTIESSFGVLLPLFAETRQVIAVEQQAHGRTADIDRPLTFPQMADDTAALLRHLDIEKADLFGYSDECGARPCGEATHPARLSF